MTDQDQKPQDPPVAQNAVGDTQNQPPAQDQNVVGKALQAAEEWHKKPGVKMLDVEVTPFRVSEYLEGLRLHEGTQSADKKTTVNNYFKLGAGNDYYFSNNDPNGKRFFGGRARDVFEVEHKVKGGRLTGYAEGEIHGGVSDIITPQSIPAAAFAPDPSLVPPNAPPVLMTFSVPKVPDINGRGKIDAGFLPDHTSVSFGDGVVKAGLVGMHVKTADKMGTFDWRTSESACVTPVSALNDAVRLDVCGRHETAGGYTGDKPNNGLAFEFEADSTKIEAGLQNMTKKVFHKKQR